MAKFAYKAIDSAGNEVSGLIEAKTENDALNEIGRKGLYVTSMHAAHVGDMLRQRWQEQKDQWKQLQTQKQIETRKKHPRQRLVVRYKDGRTDYGVCFALNPKETGFHLDRMTQDGTAVGETIQVRFSDLKAVFHVKSFDGKYDPGQRYAEYHPEGSELLVEFTDGELVRGYTLNAYVQEEPRFYLIPADPKSNNISILVEASCLKGVWTPEQYEAKRAEERAHGKDESADLSHEESMGDFYFQTRNYTAALEQYRQAAKQRAHSRRLRKKMLAAEYNVGVQFIKRRDYPQALAYMERILQADPHNAHAKKKVAQLRRIIEKAGEGGPDSLLME